MGIRIQLQREIVMTSKGQPIHRGANAHLHRCTSRKTSLKQAVATMQHCCYFVLEEEYYILNLYWFPSARIIS